MRALRKNFASGCVVVLGLCLLSVVVGHAQSPRTTTQSQSATANAMDPEREALWNSPEMLRARAWLHDYCSKSAKVTPELAKKYQDELHNMSTAQLRLWLLKFEHDEEQRQQQNAMWQQAHSASLAHAMAAQRATRQSYAAINREQSAAAGEAQQQIDQQQIFEQENREANAPSMFPSNAVWGYPGYGGYGGIHYHYHLYGN